MTYLLLVRHADAVPLGENGATTDFDRALSEHGVEQAKALAAALTERGIVPDVVATSPLVRAVQTAEPLRELLNPDAHRYVISERLSPGELRPRKLAEELLATEGRLIAAVGHNDHISQFAAWLLGAPEGSIDLKKGAAMLIAFPDGIAKAGGTVEWLVTPKWYLAGVMEPA